MKIYNHMLHLKKIRYGKTEEGRVITELDHFISINNRIENNFAAGKRVVISSSEIKKYIPLIEENIIESELDIGDSFLIKECIDMGGYNFYISLNGITLKPDRFGFEQYFNSYYFTPESCARNVLQGIGIKFDKSGNIIK